MYPELLVKQKPIYWSALGKAIKLFRESPHKYESNIYVSRYAFLSANDSRGPTCVGQLEPTNTNGRLRCLNVVLNESLHHIRERVCAYADMFVSILFSPECPGVKCLSGVLLCSLSGSAAGRERGQSQA